MKPYNPHEIEPRWQKIWADTNQDAVREDTDKPNLVWVSLRSVDDFPCNLMAEEFFNGGGHLNASGGRVDGTIEDAIEIAKKAIIAYQNKLK